MANAPIPTMMTVPFLKLLYTASENIPYPTCPPKTSSPGNSIRLGIFRFPHK